jgi:D-proline reductase (dithiol) PrdB
MPRLEELIEAQRNSALMFPCMEHDDSPVTPMRKELSQAKVALVTSAGLHLRDDKPFGRGDSGFRVIPADADGKDVLMSHSSIGYDHVPFYKDVNITFPIDRLREAQENGQVGSLSPNYYSFMGAQRDPSKILSDGAPEVAQRLLAEGVDAVILTPT